MAKPSFSVSSTVTNTFGRAPQKRPRRALPRLRQETATLWQRVRHMLAVPHWGRVGLFCAFVLSLSALLALHLLPDRVSLRAGDTSAGDIRAMRPAQFVDRNATHSLQDAAAARVEPVYSAARFAAPDADQALSEAFALLRRSRPVSSTRAAALLAQQVGLSVSPPAALAPLLSRTEASSHLEQAERVSRDAVASSLNGEIIRSDRPDNLAQARAEVTQAIAASLLPREDVPAAAALARAALRPNFQYDDRATDRARAAQRGLVAPVLKPIFAGEMVVRAGEVATPETVDKLRALGLQNPRTDWNAVLSITLLLAVMTAVATVYLARHHKSVYASVKMLSLLCLLTLLSAAGLKLGGAALGVRLTEAQFGYVGMLCVAAGAMLVSALIHPRIAMVTTALLAAQSGLVLGNDARFCLLTLLSGTVAIFAVSNIRSRGDVLRAAALLCAANIVLSLVVGRIAGDGRDALLPSVVWAFFAGVLSVALFSVGAALFERAFGITTHLGLLELSDPNRPLLQKFCQIAPGTFTHSVMVGNLAVVAAEAVGADALLCRVGAYYHDLGKMRSPEYFVENQGGGDNIHERLNPSLSAIAVTAHVRHGLEIADQEHLPPVIKDFITQHHGTSLIKYFYYRQTGGDCADAAPGLEQRFRYAGPRPQTRETAILMLADGVEAASRTLDKPTPARIADLVDRIFEAQLSDGQLDECDLTLRDLRGIREAFVRLLSGMLHTRIEYPDFLKDAKADRNGTSDPLADAVPALAAGGGERGDGPPRPPSGPVAA